MLRTTISYSVHIHPPLLGKQALQATSAPFDDPLIRSSIDSEHLRLDIILLACSHVLKVVSEGLSYCSPFTPLSAHAHPFSSSERVCALCQPVTFPPGPFDSSSYTVTPTVPITVLYFAILCLLDDFLPFPCSLLSRRRIRTRLVARARPRRQRNMLYHDYSASASASASPLPQVP